MGEGVFLGQLQAFLETARLGNVTRAADALFLSQPALSSRLKRLEHEIGGVLLIRDHKGARLTEVGRAFLPQAERAVAILTDAHRAVAQAQVGLSGELTIAGTQTMNMYVLPAVVAEFLARNPTVNLSLRTAASESILELVLGGEVEVGFGRSLQHPDAECVPLFSEEFVFAVGPKHPFAAKSTVTTDELAGESILTLFRSPVYEHYLLASLRLGDLSVHRSIDVDNAETGKQLLMQTVGVGLIPKTAIGDELADGTLVEVFVQGITPLKRAMVAITAKGALESSNAAQFLAMLKRRLSSAGHPISLSDGVRS